MNSELLQRLAQLILLFLPAVAFTIMPLYYTKSALETEVGVVKKAFCVLNACAMVLLCNMYASVLSAPLEMNNDLHAPLYQTSLICFGLCLLLGALFFKTLTKKLPALLAEENLESTWRYLLFIPLALSIAFLWGTPREAAVVMTGRVRVTSLLFLTMVPPVIWLFYHGAWWITTRLTENAQIKMENDLLQMEGKRYKELREYMEETRALRHDFRQHVSVISKLNAAGKPEELADYLGQYEEQIADTHLPFCDNNAVDAIASHYDALARVQETVISWDLELPKELPVPETDYCAVFGNLVENALHAVNNLPPEKRTVFVTSKMVSDVMLGLSVRNPYDGIIALDKHGVPRSTKLRHGIGLKSVRNTVRKYHGSLDINTDDNMFSAAVLMYRS